MKPLTKEKIKKLSIEMAESIAHYDERAEEWHGQDTYLGAVPESFEIVITEIIKSAVEKLKEEIMKWDDLQPNEVCKMINECFPVFQEQLEKEGKK